MAVRWWRARRTRFQIQQDTPPQQQRRQQAATDCVAFAAKLLPHVKRDDPDEAIAFIETYLLERPAI
jgi:hypothetical protein